MKGDGVRQWNPYKWTLNGIVFFNPLSCAHSEVSFLWGLALYWMEVLHCGEVSFKRGSNVCIMEKVFLSSVLPLAYFHCQLLRQLCACIKRRPKQRDIVYKEKYTIHTYVYLHYIHTYIHVHHTHIASTSGVAHFVSTWWI